MQARIYSIGNGMKLITEPELKEGQILWLNGYGQEKRGHDRRVIYKIEKGTFGTTYHCVNIDKLTLSREDHPKNDKEIFGIGIYYTEGDVFTGDTQNYVVRAIENERVLRESAKIAAERKARVKETKTAELLAEYPYLEPLKGSKKSSHALGAANLRKLLKKEFPGIVFSVKSESYSGGDSISVHWTDAATNDAVDKFADLFEECSFDGMQDLEIDRDNIFADIFGGAKYVNAQRTVSNEKFEETAKEMGYDAKFINGRFEGLAYGEDEMIRRATWAKSFYTKVQS